MGMAQTAQRDNAIAARGAPGSDAMESALKGQVNISRQQYRELADKLVLDDRLWSTFFERCQLFASVGIYGHKDPRTVAAAGLKGMSMGMTFMEAIDRVRVIHGTPVIRGAAAVVTIFERCPGAICEVVESTDEACTWRMGRPGRTTRDFTATMADVQRAGLDQKNKNYALYPRRMLKWLAASEGAQEMFGDILAGIAFAEEPHAMIESDYVDVEVHEGGESRVVKVDVNPPERSVLDEQAKQLLSRVADAIGSDRKEVYRTAVGILREKGHEMSLPFSDQDIALLIEVLESMEHGAPIDAEVQPEDEGA